MSEIFKKKNLLKLFAAEFTCGLYFAVPIQTLFYIAKGLSFTQIMWLESFFILGSMLFEVPTGIFGDKYGRKNSLVWGMSLLILSWVPFFLADRSFALYAASFFMTGVAIAFFSGADEALIYDELKSHGEESKMQKIYGIYNGAYIFAMAFSSLIGGFLAIKGDVASFLLLFKLSVVGEVISLLIYLTVKEPPITSTGRRKEHLPEKPFSLFKNGLILLNKNPNLRRIALLSIFSAPFAAVIVYAFQPYFQMSHVPIIWFGISASIGSLFSAASSVFAHKFEKWFGVERGMLFVTLIPAIIWILMGLIFNPVIAIMLVILHAGIRNAREPIFSDYQNRHIESYNRATVISTIALISSLFNLVMRPLYGYLIDINLSFGFIVIGIFTIAGSLLFRIKDKHVISFESSSPSPY